MPPAKTQPKPTSPSPEVLPIFYMDIDSWDAGMPDDFVGTIRKSRYAPWHYPGKDKYMLFLRWDIEIEEEDGRTWMWREHMQAGWLRDTQPSNDSPTLRPEERKPAGTTKEVYAAMAEGTASIDGEDETLYEGLYCVGRMPGRDQDACQALKSLRTLGFDLTAGPGSDILEGIRARFMRMPSERQLQAKGKKSGIVVVPKDGENLQVKEKEFKVLSAVELLPSLEEQGNGSATAMAKPKPVSTSAKPAASDNTNGAENEIPFEDRLANHIYEILFNTEGKKMNRHALHQKLLLLFPQNEKTSKLIPFWNKSAFTKFDFLQYEKETGIISLVEEGE